MTNNGHATANAFVSRSIHRVKDTEKVAFIKEPVGLAKVKQRRWEQEFLLRVFNYEQIPTRLKLRRHVSFP